MILWQGNATEDWLLCALSRFVHNICTYVLRVVADLCYGRDLQEIGLPCIASAFRGTCHQVPTLRPVAIYLAHEKVK